MKQFILKLLFFIALLLVMIDQGISNNNPFIQWRKENIEKINNMKAFNPSVIFLGDSHAEAIPQNMLGNKTYNLAAGSDSLNEMYIKLKYAIQHNPEIRTVILSGDFHNFSDYRLNSNNRFYYKSITDANTYEELYNEKYSTGLLSSLAIRFPVFDKNIYVFTRKKIALWIRDKLRKSKVQAKPSHKWKDYSVEKRKQLAKKRAKELYPNILNNNLLETFQNFLSFSKENNVKVIAISYPLSKEMALEMETYDVHLIRDVYKSFGLDLWLDYTRLVSKPEFFADQDHLNLEGAKIFLNSLYADTGVLY